MKSAIWIVNGILLVGLLALIGFFVFNSARENFGTKRPAVIPTEKQDGLPPNINSTDMEIKTIQDFLKHNKPLLETMKKKHKDVLDKPPDGAQRVAIENNLKALKAQRQKTEAEMKKCEASGQQAEAASLKTTFDKLTEERNALELALVRFSSGMKYYMEVKSRIETQEKMIENSEKQLKELEAKKAGEQAGGAVQSPVQKEEK